MTCTVNWWKIWRTLTIMIMIQIIPGRLLQIFSFFHSNKCEHSRFTSMLNVTSLYNEFVLVHWGQTRLSNAWIGKPRVTCTKLQLLWKYWLCVTKPSKRLVKGGEILEHFNSSVWKSKERGKAQLPLHFPEMVSLHYFYLFRVIIHVILNLGWK